MPWQSIWSSLDHYCQSPPRISTVATLTWLSNHRMISAPHGHSLPSWDNIVSASFGRLRETVFPTTGIASRALTSSNVMVISSNGIWNVFISGYHRSINAGMKTCEPMEVVQTTQCIPSIKHYTPTGYWYFHSANFNPWLTNLKNGRSCNWNK